MWALRRASFHLRNRFLSLETTRICTVKSEIGSYYCENFITELTQSQVKRGFHNKSCLSYSNSSSVVRLISSLAGDDNGVLEDSSACPENRHDEESMFESDDLSVEVLEGESEAISGFADVVYSAAAKEVAKALDEWVEAGNEVTAAEVASTMLILRSRQLYAKALKLYEWLESSVKIEFTVNVYASRVELIAQTQGTVKAEEYIQQIPESFRTEAVYNSLLRRYCLANNVNESEKLFNKMKTLFPLTVRSCNQMLYLYQRMNRKKIADIMEFMEKESIKPSSITYQILITRRSNSTGEMEQIFETMKSNGVEPTLYSRKFMAQRYAASGKKRKAEAILKEMEGGDLVKNRAACCLLLPVYASLGRGDEVGRIWKECESNPNLAECRAAMKAFRQLKRIEDFEAAFEKMSEILGKPTKKYSAILLHMYADHNMVAEAEDLFRRMRESGVPINMHALDALVTLYMGAGEVEKAVAVLTEVTRVQPRIASFLKILDGYAARGDVHNAEKIFLKMRNCGYTTRPPSYHSLLYAYINSKTPAEGFEQRLERDNVVPDEKLSDLIAQTAAFRSSAVV